MAVGCLASLVLWVAVVLLFIQPALLPVLVALVLVLITVWAVNRNPDWPVY